MCVKTYWELFTCGGAHVWRGHSCVENVQGTIYMWRGHSHVSKMCRRLLTCGRSSHVEGIFMCVWKMCKCYSHVEITCRELALCRGSVEGTFILWKTCRGYSQCEKCVWKMYVKNMCKNMCENVCEKHVWTICAKKFAWKMCVKNVQRMMEKRDKTKAAKWIFLFVKTALREQTLKFQWT